MRSYRPSSRPVSEMDQLASLSRSGGHAQNEDALLDFKTQQRYRAHLEDKLRAFWDREAATGLGEFDAVSINDKKRWFMLNDILLHLRKLREAIISTGRVDAFAVEVYELSARIALQTSNHAHLISALSRLVPDLYVAHDLSLASSSISSRPLPSPKPTPPTTSTPSCLASFLSDLVISAPVPSAAPSDRALYVSVLLIYHLTHLSSPPSYLSLIESLPSNSFPPSSLSTLPPLVLRAELSSSFVTYNRLLASPAIHPLERICLSFGSEERRARAWTVVKGAYMDVGLSDLGWLGVKVLGLERSGGDDDVASWLKEKGVEPGEKGRWAIRKGRD